MLKRGLTQFVQHGRRLQRHLALRRVAARHVRSTTPMPFLQRIGLVSAASDLGQVPRSQWSSLFSGSAVPVDDSSAEPLMDAGDSEQQDLTHVANVNSPLEETSLAMQHAAEVSSQRADADRSVAEPAPPHLALVRSGEPPHEPRVVPDETSSSRTPLPIRGKTIPAEARVHLRAESEAAATQADSSAVPAQLRSPLHPEPAGARADRVELKPGAEMTPLADTPAALPATTEATIIPPTHDSANQANQVGDAVASFSAEPADEFEAVSHSDIAQAQPEAEQSSPSLPKPAVTPNIISSNAVSQSTVSPRRRAQIQEVPAELKPLPVVAFPKRPRPAKSQETSKPRPSSSPAEAPAAEVDAAESQDLFTPRDNVDRSPSAWRERLAEAIRVETENNAKQALVPPAPKSVTQVSNPEAPKPLAPRAVDRPSTRTRRGISTQPGRLPESTRRFLNPLVGFDPRDVQIHQGPAVSRVLAASGADAMAAGDSILLGPGHDPGTAETLGVLAHELTHIARGREARFVPPVIRAPKAQDAGDSVTATTDEEKLAERVESRVEQAARRDSTKAATGSTASANRLAASAPVLSSAMPSAVSPAPAATEESWGGLPAPWEPMPEWVSAPQVVQPAPAGPAEVSVMPSVSAPAAAASAESAAAPSAESAAAPARAESGRSLPEAGPHGEGGAHQGSEEKKQAGPDLDALARQVYTIVRRRLAADRRREFM